MSMEHEQWDVSPKKIPKLRSGKLTLRESTPRYEPQTRSLVYLGKTDGFGTDLEAIDHDDFVREAILDLVDEIPESLQGYTRSHATLERLYEGLSRYDVEPTFLDYDRELRTALTLAFQAFHLPGGVHPQELSNVRVQESASAGWSWLGKKKRDVRPAAEAEAEKLQKLIRQGRLKKSALPPAVCFKRTQLARITQPKVRTVWGYPFEMTLIEGRFAQPLIDAYAKRDSPMFIGKSMLKELPMFIDGAFHYGDGCGLDWSGFDGVQTKRIIHEAFNIIRSNLWLDDDDSKVLEAVEDYFINTPIVLPDGGVFIKHIGIPSGSFFTQLAGSIINFIEIMTLMLKLWNGVWTRIKVLSDDSFFTIPRLTAGGNIMDLDKWATLAHSFFGLTLNVKKTFIASTPEEIEFLGHASKAGSILRDEDKLLRLALYPEYRVPDPGTSLSRVRGILLDSGFKSWKLWDLYDYMEEKYGPVATASSGKYYKYVIQQDIPSGRVRMSKLWALS